MSGFWQLSFELGARDPDYAEESCFELGATSVTYVDAYDDPVLEPLPGECRLWPTTRLRALFPDETYAPVVAKALTETLGIPAGGLRTERIEDRVWEREWLRDFHARRFGQRLWVCPHHEQVTEPGAVVVLRLNRPEARNAFNPELMGDLGNALAEAEADPGVRAVVLTGTGDRAFSAGMDLRAFAAGDSNPTVEQQAGQAVFGRFVQGDIGVPIVGAANATAVAGGFELLLACDVVVASSEAKFVLSSPSWAGLRTPPPAAMRKFKESKAAPTKQKAGNQL